jgi:hypothetical protein
LPYPTLPVFAPSGDLSRQRLPEVIGVRLVQFQVARFIVRRVVVLVVDDFRGRQVSPQDRFHHESMFPDATGGIPAWMVRGVDQDVSVAIKLPSTLPLAVPLAGLRPLWEPRNPGFLHSFAHTLARTPVLVREFPEAPSSGRKLANLVHREGNRAGASGACHVAILGLSSTSFPQSIISGRTYTTTSKSPVRKIISQITYGRTIAASANR